MSEQPSPRVLIVDDDEGIRDALRDLLAEEGIDVVGQAVDGDAGFEAVQTLSPDIVLMDLRMPGVDGVEATKLIKDFDPDMQVIILTAYDDPALNQSADAAGAFAYLIKGSSASLVRDVIMEAFKLRRGLQERSAGE
ncbi:MAG: response regulator transcription factor [Actinomycetota bacterium]